MRMEVHVHGTAFLCKGVHLTQVEHALLVGVHHVLDRRADLGHRAAEPGDHQEHRGGQVRGHPGVEGELGRRANAGIVGADDHDGVAAAC